MTTEIQEYSQTEAALTQLEKQYAGAEYEVDTPEGLKLAKAARSEIRGYRTGLEKMRKDIKAPALDLCKLIDSEAKRITAKLVALEAPVDAQIKEEEARKELEREEKIAAELKRVEQIQARVESIRAVVGAINRIGVPNIEDIEKFIGEIDAIVVDATYEEFEQQAHDAKATTLSFLREHLSAAKEREAEEARIAAERAELAELRAAQDKRDQEAEEARQAEEKKQREAAEAEEKERREKFEAEEKKQREAQDKIDAEEKRIADEREQLEADQAEAKRKEEAEAEAERKRKEKAEALAKRAKFPGVAAITDALAEHFGVDREVAATWIQELSKNHEGS